MTMCASGSGGPSMTRSFPVTIDQPAGTVKVAPPGVTRGVSAATCSGADLKPIDCGDAAGLEANARGAKAANARKAARTIRYMDIVSPLACEDAEISEPRSRYQRYMQRQ